MKIIASLVLALSLAACGGHKPKADEPPANTGTGSGSAAEPAAKVCHDTANCEGYGTCTALCSSSQDQASLDACQARCDAQCPETTCPAE